MAGGRAVRIPYCSAACIAEARNSNKLHGCPAVSNPAIVQLQLLHSMAEARTKFSPLFGSTEMELATRSGLHVECSGAGDSVLLLHSSGLSGRQWRRLTPELVRRGMRAVVPDLTGHGASDAGAEAISVSLP